MDSTASSLAFLPSVNFINDYLKYYANVHSDSHNSAKISTQLFEWSANEILKLVNADPEIYTCIFLGSGATAAINRASQILRQINPKPRVLVSLMEHHSNDLPHRQRSEVTHLSLLDTPTGLGGIDIEKLEQELKTKDVSYVAVTGVSNVTGIINPIEKIAKLAHSYDSYIIIDAAQMGPHMPIDLAICKADALVLAGHKMYAPSSPGVLIIKKVLLDSSKPIDLGGGMVTDVSLSDYAISNIYPDRELAGTPNIVGSIMLGVTANTLRRVGMHNVQAKEQSLTQYLLNKLAEIPQITVYGNLDPHNRVGVISFNINKLPHKLTAIILNDYFGIAVRNQCFCAHPYVRSLIREELWSMADDIDLPEEQVDAYIDRYKGMVRISLGLYNTVEDIDCVVSALIEIISHIDYYKEQYIEDTTGGFIHISEKELPLPLSQPEIVMEKYIRDHLKKLNKGEVEFVNLVINEY